MKTNVKSKTKMSQPQIKTNKRTQNKDDIDSREGEEQLDKGDDITHNKKEKQSMRKR